VRGYQKKVIFLKDTGSHLFDEAYFVVSSMGEKANIDQSDMVFEANRIIKESLTDKEKRLEGEGKFFRKSFIIPFFAGAVVTFLITFFLFLIIK
jgi:hypothetical protein